MESIAFLGQLLADISDVLNVSGFWHEGAFQVPELGNSACKHFLLVSSIIVHDIFSTKAIIDAFNFTFYSEIS